MKKTEWFPADVKPVHQGWYDSYKYRAHFHCRRYWNGRWWSNEGDAESRNVFQKMCWRGLTEKAA
jgi:hypothetical protein